MRYLYFYFSKYSLLNDYFKFKRNVHFIFLYINLYVVHFYKINSIILIYTCLWLYYLGF